MLRFCTYFSFLSFFALISCTTTAPQIEEGRIVTLTHQFKFTGPQENALEVYSPVAPNPLVRTVELQTGEAAKLKTLFTHLQTLPEEKAKVFDEEIEYLIELLATRNEDPSEENQFEVGLAFAELLPQS